MNHEAHPSEDTPRVPALEGTSARINVSLRNELRHMLDEIARERGTSTTAIINEFLSAAISEHMLSGTADVR